MPGLITVEIITLLFPLLQIYNPRRWARNYSTLDNKSGKDASTYAEISKSTSPKAAKPSGRLYTVVDLERCLTHEDERIYLQNFACRREFTGENIMFLTQVHDFQASWDSLCNSDSDLSLAAQRRMFEAAVTIFARLVCTDTASVYINIEGRIYKALNATLGDAARAHVSKATTDEFGTISMNKLQPTQIDGMSLNSGKSMTAASIKPIDSHWGPEGPVAPAEPMSHLLVHDFEIAEGFGLEIFNEAYASVKNMVYTQTWQRYNQEKEKEKVRRSSTNVV